MEKDHAEAIEGIREVHFSDAESYLRVDFWEAFYKAWLAAFLEVVPTKADIGHRMVASMKSSYDQRWTKFWPYTGGRNGRSVPTSTIGGWLDRASLPTDANGDILVTQAIRRALVIVVAEELKEPPTEVVRLAERSGIHPPEFSVVVGRLAHFRDAKGTVGFTSEVDKALASTIDLLTRLPKGYPSHLRTSRLADQLRFFKVDDLEELTKGDGLYAGRTPYGSSFPAFAALGVERVAVVLGNPGSGKSTLVAAYCARYIRDSAGLALFVRLDDLGRIAEARREASTSGVLTREDAAASVIEAWDNWRQSTSTVRTLEFLTERIIKDADTVIAFDGLDEVALVDHRLSAVREVLHLLERSCQARLIVASRVTAYIRPFEQANEYFVAQLNSDELEAFVADWFVDRPLNDLGRHAALGAVKDEKIGMLARTPVIAGIVCYVAEDGAIKSTVFGLYRQYLNRYFRRLWRPVAEQRTSLAAVDTARATAQSLAWEMSGLNSSGLGDHVWLDEVALTWLRARTNVAADNLLELYQRDGVLVPFGKPADSDPMSQHVRWLHRTIHEHLAGRQLAEQLSRDSQAAVTMLVQAVLRPEWGVTIEHLAGGLEEFGILAPTVDALWLIAAEHDTPGKTLTLFGARLLVACGSTHRHREVVDLLHRHHEWYLLAKVDRDVLLGALELVRERGRSATEVGFLLNQVWRMDLPPEAGWETIELIRNVCSEFNVGLGWVADSLAWKVDPRRMFEESFDRLAQGIDRNLLWSEDPMLSQNEMSRLAGLAVTKLQQGDAQASIEIAHWLHSKNPDSWDPVKSSLRTLFGDYFVEEVTQAWSENDSPDWSMFDPEILRKIFSASLPYTRFEFGWHCADRSLPLPQGVDEWAKMAYRIRQVEWTHVAVADTNARLISEEGHADASLSSADGQLTTEWSASPEALYHTLSVMVGCANAPTPDRVQRILKWYCDAEPCNYNDSYFHLDSNWFVSFVNFLPWSLRVEAGFRESSGLSTLNFYAARGVVRWTLDALDSGLREDPSASTFDLLQQFVTVLIDPENDVQIMYEIMSLTSLAFDGIAPDTVERIAECLESRAVEVLPVDSELLVSILDAVTRGRYIAGLLPRHYALHQPQ